MVHLRLPGSVIVQLALGLAAAVGAWAQAYPLTGTFSGSIQDFYLANSSINGDTPYCVQTAATYASGASAGTTALNRNDGAGNVTISGSVLCLINDAAVGGTGGNLLLIKINTLDLATPANTNITLANAMSSYGPGIGLDSPAGWHGKGGSANTQADNSWKTDPPFAVPGGWVCVPVFRQSQTGFTAHDMTLTCSPDGGIHWCNPNTYNYRAGGAGCDATNWDANGDAPKCGAASSAVACTDSGYNDATHSSVMWQEPTPYDSTVGFTQQLYFFNFSQGNDGMLPFGNYLYALGAPGNRWNTGLLRMPNTIGAVMDRSQWTGYSQSNYSQANPGTGTSWTSSPQLSSIALWGCPAGACSPTSNGGPGQNLGYTRGSPFRACAGSACSLVISGAWFTGAVFGMQLATAPAPWGPYTASYRQPPGSGNAFPNFTNLMGWTQKTVDTSPFHVQVISLWDNTVHHPSGTLYWQPFELTVAPQAMGNAYLGCGAKTRFSMGPMSQAWPRKGLQYWFEFCEGIAYPNYAVATQDLAKIWNGAYQAQPTAVLTLCFAGPTCGASGSGSGWTGPGIYLNDNQGSIGMQLRDLTAGVGSLISPAMFGGDGSWTVAGVNMFDTTGAGDNHKLFSGGAAPNNIEIFEISGFLWVAWYSGGSSNFWLINGSAASWAINTWHSWIVTKSPGVPAAGTNTHLYIDGLEMPAATSPQGSPTGWPRLTAGPVSLGAKVTGTGVAWQGYITHSAMWNRPIGATEVIEVCRVQLAALVKRGVSTNLFTCP
jgi:hypothetical protein